MPVGPMEQEVRKILRIAEKKAMPHMKEGGKHELLALRIHCAAVEGLLRDLARKIDKVEAKVDAVDHSEPADRSS